MKKIFWLIWILPPLLHAQQKIWQAQWGGHHAEFLYDGLYTLDYGFLTVGGSFSASGDVPSHRGLFDAYVTKTGESGQKEWTRVWGGRGNDIFRSIMNAGDGGYVLAASSSSPQGGDKKVPQIGQEDIWLIRLDITGAETAQAVLGGAANDYPVRVVRTRDGGLLIGGVSYSEPVAGADTLRRKPGVILKKSPSRGNADYWIIKLDAAFGLEWEKSIGGSKADILTGIAELPDGRIIAAGYSNSPASGDKEADARGGNDWWIVALSPSGDLLWQRQYGGDANDELYVLAVAPDGSFFTGGFTSTREDEKVQTDMALVKWDAGGRLIWKKTYDRSSKDILQDMVVEDDGTLLLGGYAGKMMRPLDKALRRKTPVTENQDFWVIRTGPDGNKIWEKFFGTPRHDILRRIIPLRDGGYVLTGTAVSPSGRSADSDFLLIKIRDLQKPLRKPLPLEAIPNPAGDYTRIVIGKPYAKGTVEVTDLHGMILQSFEIGGDRIIPLRLRGYLPGIYIVRVKADDMENSIKVIKE